MEMKKIVIIGFLVASLQGIQASDSSRFLKTVAPAAAIGLLTAAGIKHFDANRELWGRDGLQFLVGPLAVVAACSAVERAVNTSEKRTLITSVSGFAVLCGVLTERIPLSAQFGAVSGYGSYCVLLACSSR